MKAEELRIGNYLLISLKSSNGRILEKPIGCQDIVRIFEGIGSFNYKPIPLTEEWLLKFGFVAYNHTDKENGFIIEHKNPSKSIYVRTYCEPSIKDFFAIFNRCECNREHIQYIKKVYYVHELQNLYFELTNKELELKG